LIGCSTVTSSLSLSDLDSSDSVSIRFALRALLFFDDPLLENFLLALTNLVFGTLLYSVALSDPESVLDIAGVDISSDI
jgi:hypothetical protein